ncbi:hypothetical protein J8Z24_17555 [Pseudoalteromonas sp. SCSIO 43201]|uniref:hypothetical protein n=1 Tax=Pseudoalteromonas TaxID=53246 RepID=UPI0020758F51|nr:MULTISPECIES: hypothetical protein [Pseudoalteromonas]MDW7548468.1 hypothetical protein [Pseudoalteromonas peptidolytica]USD30782.1 hypothetical protein J8Z24_17555 [Pseudoalteromonas sp. SCSIO 43201]
MNKIFFVVMRNLICNLFVILPTLFFVAAVWGEHDNAQYRLDTVNYFLESDPHKAHKLHQAIELEDFTPAHTAHFHHLGVSIALSLGQLEQAQRALAVLFQNPQNTYFSEHRFSLTYDASVWLRKGGYIRQSEHLLLCALKSARSAKEKIKTLNALAVIAYNYGDNISAKDYFVRSLAIGTRIKNQRAMGIIENNLGVLALKTSHFEDAVNYFKLAYARHQLAGRESSELNTGLNLLFVYILRGEKEMYERVSPRVLALVQKHKNAAQSAYSLWIERFYDVIFTAAKLSKREKAELIAAFNNLSEAGLKSLLKQHIGRVAGINPTTLPIAVPQKMMLETTNNHWLNSALSCNF